MNHRMTPGRSIVEIERLIADIASRIDGLPEDDDMLAPLVEERQRLQREAYFRNGPCTALFEAYAKSVKLWLRVQLDAMRGHLLADEMEAAFGKHSTKPLLAMTLATVVLRRDRLARSMQEPAA